MTAHSPGLTRLSGEYARPQLATAVGKGSNALALSGNLLATPIAAGQIANAIGDNKNSFNTP